MENEHCEAVVAHNSDRLQSNVLPNKYNIENIVVPMNVINTVQRKVVESVYSNFIKIV